MGRSVAAPRTTFEQNYTRALGRSSFTGTPGEVCRSPASALHARFFPPRRSADRQPSRPGARRRAPSGERWSAAPETRAHFGYTAQRNAALQPAGERYTRVIPSCSRRVRVECEPGLNLLPPCLTPGARDAAGLRAGGRCLHVLSRGEPSCHGWAACIDARSLAPGCPESNRANARRARSACARFSTPLSNIPSTSYGAQRAAVTAL